MPPIYDVYYNDVNPYCGQWLWNLCSANLIAPGKVDTGDIRDASYSTLLLYRQVHLFAGIGGWSYALRLAGWPDSRPVWTGSCPCQPFSIAGKNLREADPRHLWPYFFALIDKCRPPVIFGEQVASIGGREWLAGVRSDLEGIGYAVGAADLCAASVGAPHIRQRLWWVAESLCSRPQGPRTECRLEEGSGEESVSGSGSFVGVGNSYGNRQQRQNPCLLVRQPREDSSTLARPDNWFEFDLVEGWDGRTRRIKSGLCPLANGVPDRVEQLSAYGNAIVPSVASLFVRAYIEARDLT